MMRKSTTYLLFTAANLIVVALLSLHAWISSGLSLQQRGYRQALVRDLHLTDLALFTEARYTRHLAMADHHAAFQDHPVSLEHFPSGALTRPPIR